MRALGGGATTQLEELPEGVRRGRNAHAMVGGERLWQDAGDRTRPRAAAQE